MAGEVDQALREATRQLSTAGVPSAQAEARILLAYVCDREPSRLTTVQLSGDQERSFAQLITRRASRVPLQHLTGRAYFRYLQVEVGPGVFIPRPETEVMTGWAVDQLRQLTAVGQRPVVVELCTGSGAVAKAIATEVADVAVYAVELSEQAAAYAERNFAGTTVELRVQDMADALGELDGTVDLVIANPPYIPLDAFESVVQEVRDYDPALALFAGRDGLDAVRVVVDVASRLLTDGGVVVFEHAEVQTETAPEVLVRSGAFHGVRTHPDLNHRPRFTTGVRCRAPLGRDRRLAGLPGE